MLARLEGTMPRRAGAQERVHRITGQLSSATTICCADPTTAISRHLSIPPHAAYSCANVERDLSRISTTRSLRGSDGPGDEIEQRQKSDRNEARLRSVNVAIAETSLAGRKEALRHDHV
jgi:hypothetical protein